MMIQLGSKIQTKIGNVVRTGVVQSIRVQNSKKNAHGEIGYTYRISLEEDSRV